MSGRPAFMSGRSALMSGRSKFMGKLAENTKKSLFDKRPPIPPVSALPAGLARRSLARSREILARRPPADEYAEHAAEAAEHESRHRSKALAEIPSDVSAEIDADKDEELHAMQGSTGRAAIIGAGEGGCSCSASSPRVEEWCGTFGESVLMSCLKNTQTDRRA